MSGNEWIDDPPRRCFREPISEIFIAADMLALASRCHSIGDKERASHLIRLSDMTKIREWTESIWGSSAKAVSRFRVIEGAAPPLAKGDRVPVRMPNAGERKQLVERDGLHCRFCGITLTQPICSARAQSVEQAWHDLPHLGPRASRGAHGGYGTKRSFSAAFWWRHERAGQITAETLSIDVSYWSEQQCYSKPRVISISRPRSPINIPHCWAFNS